MNINQVSKMFGDMNNQEVRTLELRVGQVVRGVVTQQLPNQEALVNINGVQIKAKLEVPIMEGKAAILEVAPDSKGSFIHLRQIDPAKVGLQDPMKDILKSMQLPDKDWSNQLVRELRQEGFALNRDTLQAFVQAAKLAPPNVDLESWMQAATMAFKRGMPLTASSIAAMQQLAQGQPLHQIVSQLQHQLTTMMQSNGQQQLSPQTRQLLQQLSQSLTELTQLNNVSNLTQPQTSSQPNLLSSFMRLLGVQHEQVIGQQVLQGGERSKSQTTNQTTVNSLSQALQSSNQTQVHNPINSQASASTPILQQGVLQQPISQTDITKAMHANQQQSVASPTASQTQSGLTQFTTDKGAQQQGNTQQMTNQATSATQVNLASQTVSNTQQAASVSQAGGTVMVDAADLDTKGTQAPAPPTTSNSVQQQSGQSQQQNGLRPDGTQATPINPNVASIVTSEPSTSQLGQATLNHSQDTVKSNLLTTLQAADVPPAIKETVTQLINHITGQQIMLSTERTQSMFTHITMYIPLRDENGGQTTAIHVQTRRDRKGQLDAENCRIVFDLNMSKIGQTLVDMNVVNKIVTLNLWNDAVYMPALIDSMRPEIVEAMQKTGYSLSSMKVTPFLDEQQDKLNEVKTVVHPPDIQQLNAKQYKGVDLKV